MRERAGLTQVELGRSIGFSDGLAVSRYERGKSLPKGDNLAHLARALGVTADFLLWGESGAERASPTPAAVDEYLERDPTAALLSAGQRDQLRSVRYGRVTPTVPMVRAIALALVDQSRRPANDAG